MQYRTSESVKHYGGIAVFFNALHDHIKSGQVPHSLLESITAGNVIAHSAISLTLESVYRILYSLFGKVDKLLFTNLQDDLHSFKSKLLGKAMSKSSLNRKIIVYHHMNNFVLPHFSLFFLARKFRVKMVTSLVDFLDVDFPTFLSPPVVRQRQITRQFLLQHSEAIVPISDFVKDDSLKLGAENDKIRVIKWGVDHLSFSHIRSRTATADPDGIRSFILPAKSWAHKGHLDFLKVFLTSPHVNYRLIFIGDTLNITPNIRSLLEAYPQHQELFLNLGFVSDEERTLRFAESSGIILPSIYEGFGFPYFEAALMGKPLFCFNTKSYLEYFSNCPNPGVAPMFDFQLLHSKILNFNETRHELAISCMENAIKGLTWEKSCRSLFSLYEELVI